MVNLNLIFDCYCIVLVFYVGTTCLNFNNHNFFRLKLTLTLAMTLKVTATYVDFFLV